MWWIGILVSGIWGGLLLGLLSFPSHLTASGPADFPPPSHLAPISPRLAADLQATQTGQPVSFLVILAEQVDATRLEIDGNRLSNRESRRALIYQRLTHMARTSQAPLLAWLDSQGISYQPFYLVNMVAVQGDAALADHLSRRPAVARLVANPTVNGHLPTVSTVSENASLRARSPRLPDGNLPYGLEFINAPAVWAMGITGQGIVIGEQDTGVEWTHPALRLAYAGWDATTGQADHIYHWFDAWGSGGRPARCDPNPQVPCDDYGHGTHTVGTLLGQDLQSTAEYTTVGVAPAAQWIGCRNMRLGVGTPASYTTCFEFFLAPYPQGGDKMTEGRPDLAPHIISNSWVCPPDEGCDVDSLRQISQIMRAAGQLVIAAAGNNGSACSSVINPIGLYDSVLSVGAHGRSGVVAPFSSRGPVIIDGSNRRKPDITAPGVDVFSTWLNGQYVSSSGTSMATPHVAGAVALLWSAAPGLIDQLDLTEQILFKSATPVPANQCDPGPSRSPNNVYGYGRLDIYRAVLMARNPATVTVQIREWASDRPVPQASVTLADQTTGFAYTGVADDQGKVILTPLFAGTYIARVESDTGVSDATPIRVEGGAMTVTLHARAPYRIILSPLFNQGVRP